MTQTAERGTSTEPRDDVPAVRIERQGAVWTVLLQRPAVRNAIDGPTARALDEAFVRFDADPSASVAVLYGVGGVFCAGADLHAFGTERQNVVAPEGPGPLGPTRRTLSKPVLAAVEGPAVAGGLELAAWCDLRVADETASFGVLCRRWGVPLIDGGTVRLPRLLGMARALDLILTGRLVDAREALAMGLVQRVVPAGTARAEAEALAQTLAALPQACLRNDRASVYANAERPLAEALADEFAHGLRSLASDEVATQVARFVAGAGRHGAGVSR